MAKIHFEAAEVVAECMILSFTGSGISESDFTQQLCESKGSNDKMAIWMNRVGFTQLVHLHPSYAFLDEENLIAEMIDWAIEISKALDQYQSSVGEGLIDGQESSFPH